MSIYKGNQKITTLSVGGVKIGKVYKGGTLVFQDKIEEILTLYIYTNGSVFPSVSVGSYYTSKSVNTNDLKIITGTIGNAGSSVATIKVVNNKPYTTTFTFNREVNLNGYKYYEYFSQRSYAYISPKQLINDRIIISAEQMTTNIITYVSGTTININGNQTINLSQLNKTLDVNYRA